MTPGQAGTLEQPGPVDEPRADITTTREGLPQREGMSILSLEVCKLGWADLRVSCREE